MNGHVLLLRRLMADVVAEEDVERDGDVEHQVPVQHDHVPRQHRVGPVEQPDDRRQAPPFPWIPRAVGHHETEAHDQGGYRDPLRDEHRPAEVDVVQDVGRQHQDHRRGRHPHQEGHVGDVEAPAHVIVHPRDDEPVIGLVEVGVAADQHDRRQAAHPEMVAAVPGGHGAERVQQEGPKMPHRRLSPRSTRSAVRSRALP